MKSNKYYPEVRHFSINNFCVWLEKKIPEVRKLRCDDPVNRIILYIALYN